MNCLLIKNNKCINWSPKILTVDIKAGNSFNYEACKIKFKNECVMDDRVFFTLMQGEEKVV